MPGLDSTIKLLCDLVAIDSVNPSLVAGAAGESNIASAIEAELRNLGLDVETADAAPNRPNVVGILAGSRAGRTLMLCGHIDTVGVFGMKSPFDPVIANGRLYGRGAEDMKGGVAAMIGAVRRLVETGGLPAGKLIVAAVADEEYASVGAEALVTHFKADAAIVTEPTHLMIATGHKGFAWIEILVEGVAAHGSRPREGRDAILRMGRVLNCLEVLDRKLQSRAPHPIMGTSSLHASMITGGCELSTYPDRCLLQLERRSVEGETGHTALAELEEIISKLRFEDPELKAQARLMFDRLPYQTPSQHFLVPALETLLQKAGCSPHQGGASFWTDASILGHAGIPSVIFGPGGAGLHSAEEFVQIDQVLLCRDILAELARYVCV
jgi:acetylornithine deacetylase